MPAKNGAAIGWWLSIAEQVADPDRFALRDPIADLLRNTLLAQPDGTARIDALRAQITTVLQERSGTNDLILASIDYARSERERVRRETRAAHGKPGGATNKAKADKSYPTYKPVWEAEMTRLKANANRHVGVGKVDDNVAKKLGIDTKTIQRARLQQWRSG